LEVISASNASDSMVIKFMEENILSCFGFPFKIITDNVQVFNSSKFTNFCHKFNIIIGHSTKCYPQGNGLDESSNKTMVRVLKKIITENQRNWDSQTKSSLCTNCVTPKQSTRKSPFELVYGKVVVFPIQLEI